MNIVQEWRDKYDFTQDMAAEILGVSTNKLAQWEHQKNSDLPPSIFHMLCVLVGGKYYAYCQIEGVDTQQRVMH